MTQAHPDRITVEFEPGEPIQGRFTDATGATRPFRGWLELCAQIERAWNGIRAADTAPAQTKR
jgi:hypothetical protein